MTSLGAIDIKFKYIFTWCTYPIMKVLLINNPPFTSYKTLALTPHNEQTGLRVVTHCICLYSY